MLVARSEEGYPLVAERMQVFDGMAYPLSGIAEHLVHAAYRIQTCVDQSGSGAAYPVQDVLAHPSQDYGEVEGSGFELVEEAVVV